MFCLSLGFYLMVIRICIFFIINILELVILLLHSTILQSALRALLFIHIKIKNFIYEGPSMLIVLCMIAITVCMPRERKYRTLLR